MEYHKIETLYERDELTHKIKPELILKNPVYGTINKWIFTEKIDGTNIRAMWTPSSGGLDNFTPGGIVFGGRSDNAQIHSDLVRWLYENITKEKLSSIFPDTSVILYGEGYGAGIQKGGGLYSSIKSFILFDVFVVDTVNSRLGGWWLNDDNVRDVASKLDIKAVPLIGTMTLEDATNLVRCGFRSQLNEGQAVSEGLVGRPIEALFDKKGHRLIVKLKTKDFQQGRG